MATPVPDLHAHMLAELDRELDKLTLGAGRQEPPRERPHGVPRFHKIMLATHALHGSEAAMEWARDLALTHKARVIVASVHRPPEMDIAVAGAYGLYPRIGKIYDDQRRDLKKTLDLARSRLLVAGVDAEELLLEGSPARELAEAAQTQQVDLMIVSARGGDHGGRPHLGTVADALLGRLDASVLVARTSPRPRRILAATDGSHASYRAVAYGLQLASEFGADITVQHVLDPVEGIEAPSPGLLRDAIARMALSPPPHVTYRLDSGKPAAEILRRADESDADLIVVGTRGLGQVKGLFLGSVSRRVANGANASVLLVKGV